LFICLSCFIKDMECICRYGVVCPYVTCATWWKEQPKHKREIKLSQTHKGKHGSIHVTKFPHTQGYQLV
jgi:hypothetical protein